MSALTDATLNANPPHVQYLFCLCKAATSKRGI